MPTTRKKPINIIVACSENRVIGHQGTLPWRIKEDLKHLYASVSGGVVIEGRKVWDELQKPYPNTKTIVLTRNTDLEFPGALKASNLSEAIEMANQIEDHPTIWIGGGQSIYEEAMDIADKLVLTLVHVEVEGDTFFPEWAEKFTKVVAQRSSSNAKYDYTFYELER